MKRFESLKLVTTPAAIGGAIVAGSGGTTGGVTTVTLAVAVMVPDFAVMVAVPAPTPRARPVPSTVTKEGALLVQVTPPGISTAVPSVRIPMARNCLVWPTSTRADGDTTVIAETT